MFGHDGQKPLELRTEEENECDEWVEAIQQARYAFDMKRIKGICGIEHMITGCMNTEHEE